MSKRTNLESLNKISNTVSEKDKKIWENGARSFCFKKETERLKIAVTQLKKEKSELGKENEILKERLNRLMKDLEIEQQSLRANEQSLIAQKTLRDSLVLEANEMRKKYEQVLGQYYEELQDYRSIYMNASVGYKELRELEIKLKKLKIVKMDLDVKIENLEKAQKQYHEIQTQSFQANIIKFAEIYITVKRDREMDAKLRKLKKEEQRLIKEHLYLSQMVKQKQKFDVKKEEVKESQGVECKTEMAEEACDKLRKFLNEDFLPCTLTKVEPQLRPVLKSDGSKVRILDVKLIKPPTPVSPNKENQELQIRRKAESIMQQARMSALNRVQAVAKVKCSAKSTGLVGPEPPTNTPTLPSQETVPKVATPKSDLPQTKSSQAETAAKNSQQNVTKLTRTVNRGQVRASGLQTQNNVMNPAPLSAQQNTQPSQTLEDKVPSCSILKNQKEVSFENDNTSKFFNTKKKSVTFQEESLKTFNLFADKENVKPASVQRHNPFPMPFTFRKMPNAPKPDNIVEIKQKLLPDSATDISASTGFTLETGQTYNSTTSDCNPKMGEQADFLMMESPFNCSFTNSPSKSQKENPDEPFKFFGSQPKTNNLFNLF